MRALADFFFRHRTGVSKIFSVALVVLLAGSESVYRGTLIPTVFFVLGVLLIGAATIGRLWCALWISGYKSARLITEGAYSVCRNPLYFFSLLGFSGIGFTTGTATLGIGFAVVFLLLYPGIISREEAVLREKFGSEFDAYCARTPRFFPRISLFREPESWTLSPMVFRRSMIEVVWFVWLIGLVALAQALRVHEVYAPLIVLP